MSGDEHGALLLAIFTAGVGALYWYMRLALLRHYSATSSVTAALALTPVLVVSAIWITLRTAASFDVRNAPEYLLLYSLLGAAWAFGAVKLLELVGISFRDDAVERRNIAAATAVAATMLAHAAIYSGANVGDGPGWWCVVFAATIGSVAWFLLWCFVEAFADAAEELTVERSASASIRLGGYMLASGILCARGSAGDWTSFDQTVIEFGDVWPVVPLALLAILVERSLAAVAGLRHSRPLAVTLALFYLGFAVMAVRLGPDLPQNPVYDLPPATGIR